MTNDLFSTVTKLPQLASLSLKYCTFCEDLDHFRLEEFSRLSLKSLTLVFDERFPVKQIHRLRDLLDYVNLRTLTDLSTNCWRLCMRLGDEPDPVVLEELEIDLIYDTDILSKLLLRCPALKIFRLTGDSHTVDNRALVLPPQTLRHLTCVEAPPSVLQGLIPGRSVSVIKPVTAYEQLGTNHLDIFRTSTLPIEELWITSSMYEDHSLWESFPDVRCLKISFEMRESREVADEVLGNVGPFQNMLSLG